MANLVVGFRESLEAVLAIVLILKVINSSSKQKLKPALLYGTLAGIVISLLFGATINIINGVAVNAGETISKLWEIIASLTAGILILSLTIVMLNNKESFTQSISSKTMSNLTSKGIFLVSLLMVSREGVETILFMIASESNTYTYTLVGIGLGLLFGILLYFSLIKVNINKIFNVILIYLILQIGYLIGYSVHEFIELLEYNSVMLDSTLLYGRVYDLSNTILNQKTSMLGILLNATLGWSSKPHILQFITQYAVTISLFLKLKAVNK